MQSARREREYSKEGRGEEGDARRERENKERRGLRGKGREAGACGVS